MKKFDFLRLFQLQNVQNMGDGSSLSPSIPGIKMRSYTEFNNDLSQQCVVHCSRCLFWLNKDIALDSCHNTDQLSFLEYDEPFAEF